MNVLGFWAAACSPTPATMKMYPVRIVGLRPNRLADHAWMGRKMMLPMLWRAFMKPSFTPWGLFMKVCHCGRDWRLFIRDMS